MACGGIITPVLGFAAAGMLSGAGLGLTNLSSAVNSIAGTSILAPVTAAINSAPGILAGLGASSPLSFLANAVPSTLSSAITSLVPGSNVLTSALQNWGGNVFGGAISEFGQTFTQLQGFATNAFQTLGAVDIASTLGFADLGINATNYIDAISGGLGNLISPAISDVQGALGALGGDFLKVGGLLNFDNLSQLGSPGSLVTTLVNNGLGNIGGVADKLVSAGVNLADITNPAYSNIVQKVLGTVSGSDLGEIASKLGAALPDSVRTAADLLSVEKLLPSVPLNFGSFPELGNKLSEFVQESGLRDAANFGNLLGRIEIPNLPLLEKVTEVIPDSVKSALTSTFGTGTGRFNNPTLTDMLGTVTGINVNSVKDTLLNAVDAVASLSQGQDLINIANSMIGADPLDLPGFVSDFENKLSEIAAIPDQSLQSLLTSASAGWFNQAKGILDEKNLLDLAGVNFDFRSATDKNIILSLATNLHEAGIDQFDLKSSQVFEALASNDTYGEAIKAALVEGRNLQRMLEKGFQTTNKITVR